MIDGEAVAGTSFFDVVNPATGEPFARCPDATVDQLEQATYRDVEQALAAANATQYGLCGSVWTRDVERGAAVARKLECGTAWVNQHLELSTDAPFGGIKWSGVGHENGRWGLDGYCNLQVVQVASA